MHIEESQISCGVQELVDIGEHPNLADYKQAMAEGMGNDSQVGLGCFIIASVPSYWKNSIKFLKSVGFKIHGVRKNPNSGNRIALLSKTLTEKERKRLAGNHCRDCYELIPSNRRLCDYCKEDNLAW